MTDKTKIWNESDIKWMNLALEEAKKAEHHGEIPVGAVLVNTDGFVTSAFNCRENMPSPIAHAEILSLQQGAKILNRWRLNECTLYVTLEPCLMCAGAIVLSRINRLVFGATDPKAGAVISISNVLDNKSLNHKVIYEYGLLQEQSSKLLKTFFKKLRDKHKNTYLFDF